MENRKRIVAYEMSGDEKEEYWINENIGQEILPLVRFLFIRLTFVIRLQRAGTNYRRP